MRKALIDVDRSEKLLYSLSHASENVLRAQTPGDVYETIGVELKTLGYDSYVFEINDAAKTLEIVHASYPIEAMKKAEKLVGFGAVGFKVPLPGTSFEQIIADRNTVFYDSPVEEMTKVFPKPIQSLVPRLAGFLGIEKIIFAPLIVYQKVFGLLLVTGSGLSAGDVSSISAFANQASIALENTHLYQELKSRALQLEKTVTERTSELSDSEEKYRVLVERAMDGIVIAQDGIVKFANRRFVSMHGYELDEVVGKSFLDILPAESQQAVLERYEKRLAGEEIPAMYEMEAQRKDGSRFTIEVNAGVIPYEGGMADLVYLRDTSERKEIEDHIRYQAGLLRGVSDAIISSDEYFVIQSWNKTAEKIYGWLAEEVVGKAFADVVQPDYITKTRQQVEAEFAETGKFEGEIIHHRKDGTPFYVHGIVNAIKDDAGNTTAVVAVSRDISTRKETEAELAKHVDELERFNRLAIGREQRVIDLKQRVNELLRELGREPEFKMAYRDE